MMTSKGFFVLTDCTKYKEMKEKKKTKETGKRNEMEQDKTKRKIELKNKEYNKIPSSFNCI
jgi:hypothetical protein